MRGRFQVTLAGVPGEQHVLAKQFACGWQSMFQGGVKTDRRTGPVPAPCTDMEINNSSASMLDFI